MKKFGIGCGILAVLGVIVLIIVAFAGGSYNRLVKLSQGVDSQWAQVQNDYQRRADLVPSCSLNISRDAATTGTNCPTASSTTDDSVILFLTTDEHGWTRMKTCRRMAPIGAN